MDRIKFNFIKSNFYRVIHVDGAYGGLTPRGGIFFALYNERLPIPQITVNQIADNAMLGPEIVEARQARDGVVREVEVGVAMDMASAEAFHKWLGDRIAELQKVVSEKEKEKK